MIVNNPRYGKLKVGLTGDYQLKNVATVLTCVDELNKLSIGISKHDLLHGLSKVISLTGLKGRWQTVMRHPRVVLDTGHNVDGIKYISAQLKKQQFNELHFIFGMVNDKDISGVLALLPQHAKYYFTAAQTKRALSPEELKEKAKVYGLKGNIYNTVEAAVKEALQVAHKDDLIFIGGSNFIVGEVLPLFE